MIRIKISDAEGYPNGKEPVLKIGEGRKPSRGSSPLPSAIF